MTNSAPVQNFLVPTSTKLSFQATGYFPSYAKLQHILVECGILLQELSSILEIFQG